MLEDYPVKDSEACFCLLDQRTFECDWASVVTLAKHKKAGNKIELFYFFPTSWLDRSVSGFKDQDKELTRWWGNSEWRTMLDEPPRERAEFLGKRLKKELGYKYAYPFAIYSRANGGRIMYHMVHASDHPEAPNLMVRAYERALNTEVCTQLDFIRGEAVSSGSAKK